MDNYTKLNSLINMFAPSDLNNIEIRNILFLKKEIIVYHNKGIMNIPDKILEGFKEIESIE